tara:strand:+ start:92160 stop:92900 length:741 start_codon:yes stop_codon:yes gene_type:complete
MKNYKNLYFNGLGLVSNRKGKSTKYWGVSKVPKSQRYTIRVFNELVGQPQSVSGNWSSLAVAAEISALMYYLLTRGVLKRANSRVLYETNNKNYFLFEFRSAGNWVISKPVNTLVQDYQSSSEIQQITSDQVHKDLMESVHFEQEPEELQLQEKLPLQEEQVDKEPVVDQKEPLNEIVDDDSPSLAEEIVDDVVEENEEELVQHSEYLPHEKEAAKAMYNALVENGVEASDSFKKFVEIVHNTINS